MPMAALHDSPLGLQVGDSVVSGEQVDIKVGNCMPLRAMPTGTTIHNVELKPGKADSWCCWHVGSVDGQKATTHISAASGEVRYPS